MLIHKDLLDSIDEKLLFIEADPSSVDLSIPIRRALEQDAITHSNALEYPHSRREERQRKKEEAKTRIRLSNAWDYAVANFNGALTDRFLKDIAAKIEDRVARQPGYRRDNVRITGDDAVFPPRAEKVQPQIETLICVVNNSEINPIERAGIFHLHSARIHPFIDGNGRTSRLVQNLLLKNSGYAPALITSEERVLYQQLLRSALRGYQEREATEGFEKVWEKPLEVSEKESIFYNYIASKVNLTLERELGELAKLPRYTLNLTGRFEPGYVVIARRTLQSYFRQHLGQVRVKDPKHGVLEVRGDIDQETLTHLLDRNGYKGRFNISKRSK